MEELNVGEEHINQAKELGISWAEGLYKSWWGHDNVLGPSFRWDEFHIYCGRLAAANLFTCYETSEWYSLPMKDLENICRKSAEKRAKELLAEGIKL